MITSSLSVESSVAVSAENVTLKSALKKPKKDVSVSFKPMNESDDDSAEDSLNLNDTNNENKAEKVNNFPHENYSNSKL